MIRLFKHYVPHVVLLGRVDAVLLMLSAEAAWVVRAHQIGMAVDPTATRLPQLISFAAVRWRRGPVSISASRAMSA